MVASKSAPSTSFHASSVLRGSRSVRFMPPTRRFRFGFRSGKRSSRRFGWLRRCFSSNRGGRAQRSDQRRDRYSSKWRGDVIFGV